jgi:xanthine dehydrogenase iron-sulfur cluster and FAD-binding subunit A
VKEARLVLGGVAPWTKSATKTAAFLKGKTWDQETFDEACEILRCLFQNNKNLKIINNKL